MTDNSKVPVTVKPKGKPRGGSRKGKANKINASIKEMLEVSLHKVGGAEYFERQAEENPGAYMALVAKILPKNMVVEGNPDNPIVSSIKVTFVNPK
jgi:hypothetical protein